MIDKDILEKVREFDRWVFRTYCIKQIGKKAYPLIKEKMRELFSEYYQENGNVIVLEDVQ